ncbi:phage upper tail fiber protein [Planococcus beigongshangi]|uniref:phage upper tail fiber protein n=1 Tax=Planococcus beigongshangi TaxID=2782536 RepID=UPI00193BF133|nr:hypothetical protein [Planococcus beigongshangi]
MAKPEPFYIDVDLKKNTQYEVPSVTQMDTATFFIVRITDDGRMVPGLLDYFSTITMTSERPDRKSFYILGKPVEGKENEILFHLGTDETTLTGNVQASIQFYSPPDADNPEGRITSSLFRYTVKKDLSGEYVPSEREGSLIETVLIRGPEIMAAAEKATADAIKAMNDLTGAVSGALENLQADKAAALKEMADATLKANTAADNADDERQQLTTDVTSKIAEVEAVRLSTVDVKDATQDVQDATELVRENTEAERLATAEVRENTELVRQETDAIRQSTVKVRDESNAAGEFAQEQGKYAKLQGDLQAEQMTDVAGVLEYVQDDFLPGIAESVAETGLFVRQAMSDQNTGNQLALWTGTLAEYNALDTKNPAVVYMVRK